MSDYTVLGAGAMGTAVSSLIASNNHDVLMWARRKAVTNAINKKRINIDYMPWLILPERVNATSNIKECVDSSEKIVLAIPSHGVVKLCEELKDLHLSKKLWLSVVKGIDTSSRRTISQVLRERLLANENKIVVLSGPNFAVEIIKKVPTIGVLGGKSETTVTTFRNSLKCEHFLVKATNDVQGVEIGGILKNVGAIAIGLIDGLNLGDNTRGLVFSRYIQEIMEIGIRVFKAKRETLLGPACLGDMIATAFSLKSRNRVIGLLASKCITSIPNLTFITEGKNNAKIVKELANMHRIKAPITEFVDTTLSGTKPYTAFNKLWKQLKEE